MGESGRARRFGRYTVGARIYDIASLEWPIYRPGRQAGIEHLDLQPGDRVLDLGCGTGLNFADLDAAIGPTGTIVGVDLSASMLARAYARVQRNCWSNVSLVQANAGAGNLERTLSAPAGSTRSLPPMRCPSSTTERRRGARRWPRPGRVAGSRWWVLLYRADGGPRWPRWRGWRVLLAVWDLRARPWEWVARDSDQVEQRILRGGHIHVAAGTLPAGPLRTAKRGR